MRFWQRSQKRKSRRCWGVNLKVSVDGKAVDLGPGANLGQALEAAVAAPRQGAITGIIRGRSEKSRQTNSYWLETTKGRIRIELLENDLQKVWHECIGSIPGLEARWTSADSTAFGSFSSNLAPERGAHEYDRWEVVLGAAGFTSEKTQAIFIRKRHTAAYGVPSANRGVFAKVVGGKSTLDLLGKDDRILSVEPIVEWEALTDKLATSDLSTPLEEGMEIYTRFEAELIGAAPDGSEFFLALTRDGTFRVDAVSSSYLSSDQLLTEPIEFEHREPRLEGTVTVRTSGRGLGRTFIYKSDRTSNPGHSVVARVTSGMEMIKLARPGDLITVKVRPERIMLMGMPLGKALDALKERGIEPDVQGYSGEDAVVIRQEPDTTMEILGAGKVALTSIPANHLISIELYSDLAPKTLDYFRHVTGLKERPVGPLPVYFMYENTFLFKPEVEATRYKELLPENKPTGPVPAGTIAVSNQVAKKIGLVGVKLVDDKRYGPSGEKFEATNVIGRVLEPDKLKNVKEGETIYVMEVRY
jgi:putative methanogenesis marker protein 3